MRKIPLIKNNFLQKLRNLNLPKLILSNTVPLEQKALGIQKNKNKNTEERFHLCYQSSHNQGASKDPGTAARQVVSGKGLDRGVPTHPNVCTGNVRESLAPPEHSRRKGRWDP